ncbi:MAG: CoA pyrophosphatase [Thermaerobacter sp.]|nr:CoA pyrophosphatase [Thermaerobacter sp.]
MANEDASLGLDVSGALRRLAERLDPDLVLPAGRPSAVLVLLYPDNAGLRVLLTQRAEDLDHHKGQISFPGGSCDPEDEDYWATALREAEEEVGLSAQPRRLGHLPALFIPVSGYAVAPCVGYVERPPQVYPRTREVAGLLQPPLAELWAVEEWEDVKTPSGAIWRMPVYPWQDYRIWGATARMLHTLRRALRP